MKIRKASIHFSIKCFWRTLSLERKALVYMNAFIKHSRAKGFFFMHAAFRVYINKMRKTIDRVHELVIFIMNEKYFFFIILKVNWRSRFLLTNIFGKSHISRSDGERDSEANPPHLCPISSWAGRITVRRSLSSGVFPLFFSLFPGQERERPSREGQGGRKKERGHGFLKSSAISSNLANGQGMTGVHRIPPPPLFLSAVGSMRTALIGWEIRQDTVYRSRVPVGISILPHTTHPDSATRFPISFLFLFSFGLLLV